MSPSSPSLETPRQRTPSILAGLAGGWRHHAEQYPIFSHAWFKYRALSYALPVALLALALIGMEYVAPGDNPAPWSKHIGSVGSWLAAVNSLLLGRWLALRVYLRNWPAHSEAIGIAAALSVGTGTSVLLFWLTQMQGLDAVSDAGIITILVSAMLFVWWGGWWDLIPYLRQRRELQDAARQREIDQYKAERNAAELRLSVLSSQIEPHFLFNTLAGVRSAILSDPARGVAIIDHLVDYLRSTIPRMRTDITQMHVPLEAELTTIRAYLGVIHFRIPRLSYSIESDPAWSALRVPPLMLISLVENAVKHGIEPKQGAAHIAVVVSKITDHDNQALILRVTDNGVGFGAANSGCGIGLANLRERLKQCYADRGRLELAGNDQGGVDACIIIPIEAHGR